MSCISLPLNLTMAASPARHLDRKDTRAELRLLPQHCGEEGRGVLEARLVVVEAAATAGGAQPPRVRAIG